MALGSGSFAQFVSWRYVVAKRDSVIDVMYSYYRVRSLSEMLRGKHRRYSSFLLGSKLKAALQAMYTSSSLNRSCTVYKNLYLPRWGKASCFFSQPGNHLAISRLSPMQHVQKGGISSPKIFYLSIVPRVLLFLSKLTL